MTLCTERRPYAHFAVNTESLEEVSDDSDECIIRAHCLPHKEYANEMMMGHADSTLEMSRIVIKKLPIGFIVIMTHVEAFATNDE